MKKVFPFETADAPPIPPKLMLNPLLLSRHVLKFLTHMTIVAKTLRELQGVQPVRMGKMNRAWLCSALCAFSAAGFAPVIHATNGYFQIGYGAKSRAMVGATTALPQDSLAAAMNPAGMGLIKQQADASLALFSPIRSASSAFGGTERASESDNNLFPIPNVGYVDRFNDRVNIGISIYANGGMNTTYKTDTAGELSLFGADTDLGINMSQLIFAPTVSFRAAPDHVFGVSLLAGYQQFKAYGLKNFCGLRASGCADPYTKLTDQGTDTAHGFGGRIGWMGRINTRWSMGAAYSTKIYMTEFDKYKDLFAEQGDFDVPENYSVGVALRARHNVTFAFDVQRILYNDVKSIANPGPSLVGMNPFADGQGLMGSATGLGFGWQDMTVYKLAMVYEKNAFWTWRAGVSHGKQPILEDEATFNIIAPAVIETNVAMGFSYRPGGNNRSEWSVTYHRAMQNEVKGDFPQAFGGTPGAEEVELKMYENILDIGYTLRY